MNITIKKASNKDDIVLDAIEAYKLIDEMMDIGKKVKKTRHTENKQCNNNSN